MCRIFWALCLAVTVMGIDLLTTKAGPPDYLAQGFANPPLEARTRAYWWWLNGNVTKEAITRDLEWMKAIGMGGGLIFDAGGPAGPTPTGPLFASPAWRGLFQHALKEANRLNLELSLSPQSGWNLGGPMVTPEQTTKKLCWSESLVTGPAKVDQALPLPPTKLGFYRDVAVLAYRQKTFPDHSPTCEVRASSYQEGHEPQGVLDGKMETFWVSKGTKAGDGPSAKKPHWLTFSFQKPLVLTGVIIHGRPGYAPHEGEWQISSDGKTYQTLKEFIAKDKQDVALRFPKVESRWFRLLIKSSFDPKFDKARNVQVAEISFLGLDGTPLALGVRRPISQLDLKAAMREVHMSAPDCAWMLEDVPNQAGEEDVLARDVADLSDKLDAQGRLRWDAPEGNWVVLRFGYTPTGAHVSTFSGKWSGLVVDHLDPAALRTYWRQVVEPLLAEAGPLVGKAWKGIETDSWEGGGLNWTTGFEKEFASRRGYDLRPYLPIIAGRIVDNREISHRFLADFRRTIGDLIADHHYKEFAQLVNKHGMVFHPESGGPHGGPFDALQNLGRSDWVMSEFWAPSPHRPKPPDRFFVKQAASAAHIYGKKIVCAEGFTTIGPHWNDLLWAHQRPAFDLEACAGLNLVFWHAFTCSPQEMGIPGQEYFAGTHFNPQITWAKQAPAFIGYLNRCQFLLQQGRFVADVCYYYGDHVPNFVRRKHDDPARVLPNYDYDVFNEEVLLTRMCVKDGRITLPDGLSYRVMVLPSLKTMSLPALRKIDELVKAGAVVIGPPPQRITGLQGYPKSDVEFKNLVDQLWSQGRISADKSAKEMLSSLGVPGDCEILNPPADLAMDYIHRIAGETHIYFLSNQGSKPVKIEALFRVKDLQPEIWDPVTGERRDAGAFTQVKGRTKIPLEFPPHGSLFVLFRKPIPPGGAGAAKSNFPVHQTASKLPVAWKVTFDPRWGGPGEPVLFDNLISWTQRPEKEIRYYSGTATYQQTFDVPEKLVKEARLVLDLGDLMNLAEIRLNGKKLGVVWTPPFRVPVGDALIAGNNLLEIDVANTWYNRLILDQELPSEKRLTRTNVRLKQGAQPLPSGLLGPVTLHREVMEGNLEK